MNEIQSSNGRSLLRLTAVLIVMMLSNTALAQQGQAEIRQLQLRVAYGHSDNIRRDPLVELDSNFTIAGLTVDWVVERPRIEISVVGDLDYYFYSEPQLEDRPDGVIDARFTVNLVPDRISWFVADNYSQIRGDVSVGNTPNNLNEFNVISTGIDADIPLGNRTSILASVSGADRRVIGDSSLDSTEAGAGVSLLRQVRPRTSLEFVMNVSKIKYDDIFDTEFDIERVFVRYQRQLRNGDVTISAGANRLKDNLPGSDASFQPLVDFRWTRDVGTRSQVLLTAIYQIRDLASSISAGNTGTGGQPIPGQLTATRSPFDETQVGLFQSTAWDRSTLVLGVRATEQKFESPLQQDARIIGLDASWARRLTPSIELTMSGFLGIRNDIQSTNSSDDFIGQLAISKTFARRFSIIGAYQYNSRSADNNTDFTENIYRIDLAYLFDRS